MLLRDLPVFRLHILVRGLDVLQFGYLQECQALHDLLQCIRAQVFTHLLLSRPRGLQIFRHCHAVVVDLPFSIRVELIDHFLNHHFRRVGLRVGRDLSCELVAHQVVRFLAVLLLQLAADVCLQLFQGLKFGDVLGKLVVDLGHFLLLHLMEDNVEHSILSGQFLRLVVFREGDLNVPLLPGTHAADLILKAGDQAAAAQLQTVLVRLSALEGHSVHGALKVDEHRIPHFGRPVHAHQLSGPPDIHVQAGLHVLFRHIDGVALGVEAPVLGHSHLGVDGELQGEGVSALRKHGSAAERRPRIRREVLRLDSVRGCLRNGILHSLLIEHPAVLLLNQLQGCPAGAEPVDGVFPSVGSIGGPESCIKLVRLNLDSHDDNAVLLPFHIDDFHQRPPPISADKCCEIFAPCFFRSAILTDKLRFA